MLAAIDGISYRDAGGNVVATRPRAPIADLDSLPFPAFHLIPFDKYNFKIDVPGHGPLQAVNIMASRGCPFDCNFCATPINWGRHVRMRSPENVVDEIEEHVRERGARVVFFYDDTFNASPKRVERDLRPHPRAQARHLLAGRGPARPHHPAAPRKDEAGRSLPRLVRHRGGLGARPARGHPQAHRYRGLPQSRPAGASSSAIIPNVFFIFSHPTETWEEARETVGIIETIPEGRSRRRSPSSTSIRGRRSRPRPRRWASCRRTSPGRKDTGSRVITLPSAQGDVPLFLDKLTWSQVSELLFRWAMSGGNVSIVRKTLRAIGHIRSFGDLKRYAVMAWVLLKLKVAKLQRTSL